MLTQEELNREYVDSPEAAKILGITATQIRFLCARKKLEGAMKLGTSGWIIPRTSVLKYKPGRRGPKPRVNRNPDDRTVMREAIKEAEKWK